MFDSEAGHYMESNEECPKWPFIVIYVSFILLLIGKSLIYSEYIGSTPDEAEHIAYLVYEKEHPSEFVPHFENMWYLYEPDTVEENIFNAVNIRGNYLGHPPLYYKIMSGLGLVRIVTEGNTAYINEYGMCIANIILVCIGMMIYFYIGFTGIPRSRSSVSLHIFYAAVCTGIPMISFTASGCNNDNLLYIGFGIFLIGVLRYFRDIRGIGTYMLVSIGTSVCLLTKLTAGAMVVTMIAVLLLTDIIRTKKLGMIANRGFLCSLPVYCIPAIYFAILYHRYGAIQPPKSAILNSGFFYQSDWYVPVEERIVYSLREMIELFLKDLSITWSCVYNEWIALSKIDDLFWWFPFTLLVLIAILGGVYSFCRCLTNKSNGKYVWCTAAVVGLGVMVVANFLSVYRDYIMDGYFGGIQGRYYMFTVPVLAFLNIILYEDILKRTKSPGLKIGVHIAILLYVVWLIGADLPFSLIYYRSYFH